MVKNGEFFVIHDMKRRGMKISEIAEELGRDRKTVRKWLEQGEPQSYHRTVSKSSVIESFATYILQRMQEGCVNAVVLLDEIRQQGYQGGVTTLRNFIRPYRASLPAKSTERFETPPGQQVI